MIDKPRVRATEPKRIIVLPRDIRRGVRRDITACAFVCATKRIDPTVMAVGFQLTRAEIEYPDKVVQYALPQSMTREIVAFDRDGDFAPGEYELKPMPKRDKPAGKRRGRGGVGRPPFRHVTAMVRQ